MDKTDALSFIGLKEPISEEAVCNKYAERYNYFQMLYANAPNKVVEKIQQQNLAKLNYVKSMLLEEIAAKKKNFDKKKDTPFIKPNHAEEKMTAAGKPVVAWLIVHTENRKAETFDLYEGINYIGRKKKDEKTNNILIEDDKTVSRTHAIIKCKDIDGKPEYVLYDGDGSKPSANGVFLNGNMTKIHQTCSLRENDTVQIGTTKLVFKIKKEHRSITGEIEEVMRTDFIRTIDVNK